MEGASLLRRDHPESVVDPTFTVHCDAVLQLGALSRCPRDALPTVVREEHAFDQPDGFAATQHISPNHVIEFDPKDPNAAVCHSYMFAQHLLEASPNGTYYLLRGSYTNTMRRTQHGWRIARLVQHRSWEDGNLGAVAEAAEAVSATSA